MPGVRLPARKIDAGQRSGGFDLESKPYQRNGRRID
jgi:hypothetical protein